MSDDWRSIYCLWTGRLISSPPPFLQIGDAWMGVTNLVHDQEDCHVKAIAEFSIDMINAASMILIDEDEPEKGYVQIRVGFHSGMSYIRFAFKTLL